MENMNGNSQTAAADPAAGTAPAAETAPAEQAAPVMLAAAQAAETAQASAAAPAAGTVPAAETVPASKEAAPAAAKEQDPAPDPEAQMQQREAELKKREESLAKKELEADAREYLKSQGLPESLLPYALQEDKAATVSCINAFKKEFDAAVEERLNEKMAGRTPKAASGRVTAGDKTGAEVFASALRG